MKRSIMALAAALLSATAVSVPAAHVDHFLGAGMTQPPRPNITYPGR
jgi:hypothetical protein